MKPWLPAILTLSLCGGVYFYSSQAAYPDVSKTRFTLLDGRRVDMAQLSGRVVLVTFWATTCAICIKEIPDLLRLYKTYAPRGLEIIAVAMPYDRPDHVLEFTQDHKLPYPVSLDIDGQISHQFGNIRVTPNHFIIDRQGGIIRHRIGILDMDETGPLLQQLLMSKD